MITRYDPFREALSLRRAMDQLFEQSFVSPRGMPGSPSLMVPMDICETPKGYEVDVALPGVRPEDIELVIDQQTLTIRGQYSQQNEHQNQSQAHGHGAPQSQGQPQVGQSGQRQRHQEGHTWLQREIVFGSFERSITFPRPIDPNAIQTNFQNGLLTIQLPVSEGSRPRRVRIASSQSQPQQVPATAGSSQA